jgi:hypothetical protein
MDMEEEVVVAEAEAEDATRGGGWQYMRSKDNEAGRPLERKKIPKSA